jgi:hypothetical protein
VVLVGHRLFHVVDHTDYTILSRGTGTFASDLREKLSQVSLAPSFLDRPNHTLFREGRINKMSVCRERKEQDSPERASRASRSGYFRPKHNFEYSRFQKLVFRYVPFALRLYRWKIYYVIVRS